MRSVSGGRLVKAMLFGILGAIVAIALDAAIAYLRKDWANPIGIALVTGVAAFSGIVPLFTGEGKEQQKAAPPLAPAYPQGAQYPYGPPPVAPQPYGPPPGITPARRKSGGVPWVVGVLLLLVLCGGGVAGLTYGVGYVGGFITGDEKGVDVLAAEQSATSDALTLTVHHVTVTSHYTRVALSAANSGETSLTLPIFGYCSLNPVGGSTLSGDSFRSDWNETIPAGQTNNGVIVFPRIPDGTTSISISFATVFGRLGGGSITVADIPLNSF